MAEALADRRAAAAGELLRRVFATAPAPIAFRLWDGSEARVGAGGSSTFTLVIRSWRVLRRLLRRPSALRFGEAYIAGDVDIEGDVFAAMATANTIEGFRVPLSTRLRVLAATLRP